MALPTKFQKRYSACPNQHDIGRAEHGAVGQLTLYRRSSVPLCLHGFLYNQALG